MIIDKQTLVSYKSPSLGYFSKIGLRFWPYVTADSMDEEIMCKKVSQASLEIEKCMRSDKPCIEPPSPYSLRT